jgi:hypothetical protein
MWALQDNTDTAQTLNTWLTTLKDGSDGQPLSELLGQANQDRLLNASSQLYSHCAVQAINANMRTNWAQSRQKLPQYDAILSLPVVRLKQNTGPKTVLQVLLGVMVAYGPFAYFML